MLKKAFKMFMEYTHWRVDANLVKRYFENSANTIEWLEDMGVVFAGAYKYFPKSEQTWHIVAVNGGIGRNGGAIMTKALMDFAKSNGAEFYLETPVTKLLKDQGGRICGVIAKGGGRRGDRGVLQSGHRLHRRRRRQSADDQGPHRLHLP